MPVSAHWFHLGVITSDLSCWQHWAWVQYLMSLLLACGWLPVRFILPLARAVPWGRADKVNHLLGKELTAAGGSRRILLRARQIRCNGYMIISIPGAKVS